MSVPVINLGQGPRVDIIYTPETTEGVVNTTTPAFRKLRLVTRQLDLEKNILRSKEVRSDRQLANIRHGLNMVKGKLQAETQLVNHDDLYASALGGTWAAVTVTGGGTITATAASSQFGRASGSFITDGLVAGDLIKTTGFTTGSNNATWRVLSVAALDIVVDATAVPLVNDTGGTIAFTGDRVQIGTTMQTFQRQRRMLDINQYEQFQGVAVDQWDLKLAADAIAGSDFTMLGLNTLGWQTTSWLFSIGGATLDAVSINAPITSFDGSLYAGGALSGITTKIDLSLKNNRKLDGVVGSHFLPQVFDGTVGITGTLSAFVANSTLFNLFLNETISSIYVRLNDPNGTDFLNVVMNQIKYTGVKMDPPKDGGIVEDLPFEAIIDPISGTMLSMQRFNTVGP